MLFAPSYQLLYEVKLATHQTNVYKAFRSRLILSSRKSYRCLQEMEQETIVSVDDLARLYSKH